MVDDCSEEEQKDKRVIPDCNDWTMPTEMADDCNTENAITPQSLFDQMLIDREADFCSIDNEKVFVAY